MLLLQVVESTFTLLYLLILASVVLSWIPGALDHPAGSAIYRLSRPLLDPIRRLLPAMGGLDLSPLIAILLLRLLQRIVVDALRGYIVEF